MRAYSKHILLSTLFFCLIGAASSAAANIGHIEQVSSAFLFTGSKLKEARPFFLKVRRGDDPLSLFLWNKFTSQTRHLLNVYDEEMPPSDLLIAAVSDELNELINGPLLYEEKRFSEVKLSVNTLKLLKKCPQGAELIHLNYLLLHDAYPGTLGRKPGKPFEISADSLEYDSEKGLLIASSHVTIIKDDERIRSDYAILNFETSDVFAEGNVFFERGSDVWSGKKLDYNFNTQRGDFGEFRSFMKPFYVTARSSKRLSKDKYLFHSAILTTCEKEPAIAFISTHKVWMVPGQHIRGRHIFLHIKGIPVMYSPYWNQNIGDRNFISMVPGCSSRMSAFLLTTFNYRFTRNLEASTHVDYRVRRGPGVGQDLLWSSSGNAKGLSTERYTEEKDDLWHFGYRSTHTKDVLEDQDTWFGDLIAYYCQDQWPDEDEEQEYPLDQERYRFRLYHSQALGERNYFVGQINYLSDPEIIHQFFRDEYEHCPEPENYIILGWSGDKYTADLMLQKRINDYYTTINRIPEASVDFMQQEIGQTLFYYKGRTSLGYLEKEWESNNTNETDYSSFRFDTDNMFYYSGKLFGFLNVMPRAGYRATYYSKTKEDYTELNETTSVASNGTIIVTSVTTNTGMRELRGELRSCYELGFESSFKAFKVWESYPEGAAVYNLRHIANPYIDYTFLPEPNMLPVNLYQFDEIDDIDEQHTLKIGMRNKLQTKRQASIYDLINADIWTSYRIERKEGEDRFTGIFFDVSSTIFDSMEMQIDVEYDPYETEMKTFNTQLTLENVGYWKDELEHRYRNDSNSLLYNKLTLTPNADWKYSLYGRYEFEESDLEAWGVSIQHVIDCITLQVGFEQEDDDFEVWLQFWFTEFPKGKVNIGL